MEAKFQIAWTWSVKSQIIVQYVTGGRQRLTDYRLGLQVLKISWIPLRSNSTDANVKICTFGKMFRSSACVASKKKNQIVIEQQTERCHGHRGVHTIVLRKTQMFRLPGKFFGKNFTTRLPTLSHSLIHDIIVIKLTKIMLISFSLAICDWCFIKNKLFLRNILFVLREVYLIFDKNIKV